MKLTARRVRKLRERIALDRCDTRPGITHHWAEDYFSDATSWGYIEVWVCLKCGNFEHK